MGMPTKGAESAWARRKYYVKREKGIKSLDIQGFLDEQMWIDWRGVGNLFHNVIMVIVNYYAL